MHGVPGVDPGLNAQRTMNAKQKTCWKKEMIVTLCFAEDVLLLSLHGYRLKSSARFAPGASLSSWKQEQ